MASEEKLPGSAVNNTKTEPETPGTSDYSESSGQGSGREDSLPAILERIKTEPVDYSEMDDHDASDHYIHANLPVFPQKEGRQWKEGQVDFKLDFSYEPGKAETGSSPAPGSPWSVEEKGSPQSSGSLRVTLRKAAKGSSGAKELQYRSYKCPRCSAGFLLFSFLKQHMASAHGERLEDDVLNAVSTASDACGDNDDDADFQNINDFTTENDVDDRKTVVETPKEDQADSSSGQTIVQTVPKKDKPEQDKDGRVRRHVCDVCEKAFILKAHLRRHKLTHSGIKQFVCDVCNKAFSQAGNLKAHKLIHTGLKQFVCDVCERAFTQPGELRRHKLIHSGEKRYTCDVCLKAFTHASYLKTHKLIHSGQKQFVCDICDKAFALSSYLKTHKLIHSGEKEYVCDVCNKAFAQACNLKRHRLIHTGEKEFVCTVCFKGFIQAGHLKRHMVVHGGPRSDNSDMTTLWTAGTSLL